MRPNGRLYRQLVVHLISVRLLWYFKTMTQTCRRPRRAALSQPEAPLSHGDRALGYHLRGVAGGARLRVSWVAAGAGCLKHASEQRHAPDRRHESCHASGMGWGGRVMPGVRPMKSRDSVARAIFL